MDKSHKQVITTHPVAILAGQGRIHIPAHKMIPWHSKSETVQCPECEGVYILTGDFSKASFVVTLAGHHRGNLKHPDLVVFEPAFTRVADCDCGG